MACQNPLSYVRHIIGRSTSSAVRHVCPGRHRSLPFNSAGWVGMASELLTPLVEQIRRCVLAGPKIHRSTPMTLLFRCYRRLFPIVSFRVHTDDHQKLAVGAAVRVRRSPARKHWCHFQAKEGRGTPGGNVFPERTNVAIASSSRLSWFHFLILLRVALRASTGVPKSRSQNLLCRRIC
jgi:hypothetical protein